MPADPHPAAADAAVRHRLPLLRSRLAALLLALGLLAAGCGGEAAVDDAASSQDDKDDARDRDAEQDEDEEEPTEEETEDTPTEPDEPVADVPVKVSPAPAEPAIGATAPPAPEPPAPADPVAPADVPEGGVDEAETMTEAMGDGAGDAGGPTTYDSYVTITDDTGAIQLDVPAEWAEVDGAPYTDDQNRQLYDVRAAADLQAFLETWDVPGVIVTASTEVAQTENEVTLLDEAVGPLSAQCAYLGREPYDDGLYVGQFDTYEACGDTETGYIVLGAVPSSRAFVIRVQVQVVDERDIEALITALNTFVITGDV